MDEALIFIGKLNSYVEERIDEIDDALMNHAPIGQSFEYWKGQIDAFLLLRRLIRGDDGIKIKGLPPNIPSRFVPAKNPKFTLPAYIIVEGESLPEMRQEVNKLMADGYKPQGGISVNMFDDDECYWYAQAMVKHG